MVICISKALNHWACDVCHTIWLGEGEAQAHVARNECEAELQAIAIRERRD